MPLPQDHIDQWVAAGLLPPSAVPRALVLAGVTPRLADWRTFVRTALLWIGVLLITAGVIFFFASNWQDLSRMTKFAMAEGALVVAVVACAVIGLERPSGKAALLGASVLTGALLALLGQTYQTGADTFELFAYWALLILPWVLVGRFGPLWLFWIVLLDAAVMMYFQAGRWGLLGPLFGMSGLLWILFAMHSAAQVAWEFGLANGVAWLERWGARVLGLATGVAATYIGALATAEPHDIGGWSILAYLAWVAAIFAWYRRRVFDVFMLSGGVLSVIIVIAVFLAEHMLRGSDEAGLLFMGITVIGLSAAGAWWIREIAREEAR